MDRLAARKRRYLEAIEKIEQEEKRLAEIDEEEQKMKEELRKVQERLHAIHREKQTLLPSGSISNTTCYHEKLLAVEATKEFAVCQSSNNVSRHQCLANCCVQHVPSSTVNECEGKGLKTSGHKSAEQSKIECRFSDEQKPEEFCFGGCCVHDKRQTERACCAERRTGSSSSADCSCGSSSVKSFSRKSTKGTSKCRAESSDAKPEKANVSKSKSSKSEGPPSRRSTAAVRPSEHPVVIIPWDTVDESPAVIADSPCSPAEDPRLIQITETYKALKTTEKLDLGVPCFKPDETRETRSVPPGDKVDGTPTHTSEVTCGSPISSPSPLPARSRPWPLLPARCPTTQSTESSSVGSTPPKRQCIAETENSSIEARVTAESPVADYSRATSTSTNHEVQSESSSFIPVFIGVNQAVSGGDWSSRPLTTDATEERERDPLSVLLAMLEAEIGSRTGMCDLLSRDSQSPSVVDVSYETRRDAETNDRLAHVPLPSRVDDMETEMEMEPEDQADLHATPAEVITIEPTDDRYCVEPKTPCTSLQFSDVSDAEEEMVDVATIQATNPLEMRVGEDLSDTLGHKIKIERLSPTFNGPVTVTSDIDFPSMSSVKVELAEPSAVKESPAVVADTKLHDVPAEFETAHCSCRELEEEMMGHHPGSDRQIPANVSQNESLKSDSADVISFLHTVKTDRTSTSGDSTIRSLIPSRTRPRNSTRRDRNVVSAAPIEPRMLILRDVICRNGESLNADVFVLPRRYGYDYRKYYVPEYDPRWARRATADGGHRFPAPDYRNGVGRVDARCKYPVHVGLGRRAFGIRFDGPPRLIELDGRHFVVPMGMALALPPPAHKAAGDESTENRTLLAFGGPEHEVIIDGEWFSVPFGGALRLVTARDGNIYSVRLPGERPPVALLGELRKPNRFDSIDRRWHSENYLNSPQGYVVKNFKHNTTSADYYWPCGEYAGNFWF